MDIILLQFVFARTIRKRAPVDYPYFFTRKCKEFRRSNVMDDY